MNQDDTTVMTRTEDSAKNKRESHDPELSVSAATRILSFYLGFCV